MEEGFPDIPVVLSAGFQEHHVMEICISLLGGGGQILQGRQERKGRRRDEGRENPGQEAEEEEGEGGAI